MRKEESERTRRRKRSEVMVAVMMRNVWKRKSIQRRGMYWWKTWQRKRKTGKTRRKMSSKNK